MLNKNLVTIAIALVAVTAYSNTGTTTTAAANAITTTATNATMNAKKAVKKAAVATKKKMKKAGSATKKAADAAATEAAIKMSNASSSIAASSTLSAPATSAPVAASMAAPNATASNTASASAVASEFKVTPRVALNNYYAGSSLTEPFSEVKTDSNTGQDAIDSRVELVTHVVLGARVTPNLTATLNPQFSTMPSNKYAPTEEEGKAVWFKPTASFARLAFGSFAKAGNFNWSGDLRFYPGITDDLKAGKIDSIVRSAQNFTYAIPGSIVTLAAYNIIRTYQGASGNNYKLESIPSVEFQLSPTLQASLGYDMVATHRRGAEFFDLNNGGTYLEAGLTIDSIPNLSINPFVDIYTGNTISADTTLWGANVFLNIL